VNTLEIQKPTTLLESFPEKRIFSSDEFNSLEEDTSAWVVFSNTLTEKQFDEIDEHTGTYNTIRELWKVGHYDVALMSGALTQQHEEILQKLSIDYALLADVPDLSVPGLIVFDMDSTAIQIECIDEIAKLAGVGELVSEVTERAMQGELDFEQSLRQRVSALKEADEDILEKVRSDLPLMPDLELLIAALKQYGWKTAIASGGFTYFSDYLRDKLALDHAQSNVLEIVDGKLTGEVLGDVVSAQTKADILHKLALQYGINIENTVAVGDGANDLIMMGAAGLGIAYHAKPKVEQQAQTSIRYSGLGGVLCILSAQVVINKR